MLFSLTYSALIIHTFCTVYATEHEEEHVLPMEFADNFTFVAPVGKLKLSILELNSRIQNDTKKAFEVVNSKLQNTDCSAQGILDIPSTFSNEIGVVDEFRVSGFCNIKIVSVETDIYQMNTEFGLLIPNITLEGTVKINDNVRIGMNATASGKKSFRINLSDMVYEGSAELDLKARRKKNELVYRKFVGRQLSKTNAQLEKKHTSEQEEIASIFEEQIGKSLLLSSLENAFKIYLTVVQQSANANFKEVDVDSYLPGISDKFFEAIKSWKSNADNGYDYLSGLYTMLIKEWMVKQPFSLDPYSKPFRRKPQGMENSWVYGTLYLSDGYVTGTNSITIAVGEAISGNSQPNSVGVVRFGPLTFRYTFTAKYIAGGSEVTTATIQTNSVSADYESRFGSQIVWINTANVNMQQLRFSGASPDMQIAQNQGQPDYRATNIEEYFRNVVKEKLANWISSGLAAVYYY